MKQIGRRPWPIRSWLILLVLATISPLALYGLLNAARSYQAERATLTDHTITLSDNIGQSVERLLEQQLVGVQALAGDPNLAAGQFESFRPIAAHYLGAIAPTGRLLISDETGDVIFALRAPKSIGDMPTRRAKTAISRRVFTTGKPEICLVPEKAGAQPFIAIDVPVTLGPRVVADLTLELPASRIQALLATALIPDGWTAIVADQNGRVAARLPEDPAMIGSTHTGDVLDFIHSGQPSETLEAQLRDGTNIVGALARTQRFGWVAGVAIPRSLMLAPLAGALIRLMSIGIVALAVSLLLALAVARRLSRPIIALAEMAMQFEHAEAIPAAPPPSLREADEVARALELAMRRRRAAEDVAQDAELRASRVIEDAPCGVILFGPDGSWRLVNQAACALLGRPAHELLGFTITSPDLDVRDGSGDSIPVDRRASARALHGEDVRGLEVSMLRGDGRRVHMLFNSAPLRDRTGQITGALTAMLDISERRAVEERLERLLQTLESRVEEEVAARQAAQAAAAQAQKMQALGQLAGGVAHDFNNVLQAISGAVSLIEHRAGNPDAVRRFARTAASAADRGAAVAGRLLAFARRSDLIAAPVEVQPLLNDVREMLDHTLGGDLIVAIEADPAAGWLLADRAQLETALVNLGTNARDAMPDGGMLTLRARREHVARGGPAGLDEGNYVCLEVTDTGTGMDAATLARATEPFFTTKPMDKGTGLGLAMVRGFAEQLNGCLAINSHPGEGTTVSLWLPAAPSPELQGASQPVSPLPAPPPPGRRVLLVDDEPEVRAMLAEELAERSWKVEQASCAQEAIELLREANFDALVADQSMPGESGVTLISLARRLRPGLPALLLTGLGPEIANELVGPAGNAAITDVAGKPIRARDLALRIERLLAGAAPASAR